MGIVRQDRFLVKRYAKLDRRQMQRQTRREKLVVFTYRYTPYRLLLPYPIPDVKHPVALSKIVIILGTIIFEIDKIQAIYEKHRQNRKPFKATFRSPEWPLQRNIYRLRLSDRYYEFFRGNQSACGCIIDDLPKWV